MKLDEKIEQIEKIVSSLEDPNIGLDEGVKLYEQGTNLAKECLKELNEVKGKINIIKKEIDVYKEESME